MKAATIKRYAGLALLLALVMLTARTCETETASAEIHFRLDEGGAELRHLYAILQTSGDPDPIGYFEKAYEQGTRGDAGTWPLTVGAGTYRLEITLTDASGRTTLQERTVILEDGTRSVVPLSL